MNRKLKVGLAGLGILVLLAVAAPLLAPFDPLLPQGLPEGRLLPPGGSHLLGTDRLSRDVLSRILFGARLSLAVGAFGAGLALAVGVLAGGAAGYFGGWTDRIVVAAVDMVLAFPRLVLLLVATVLLEPGTGLLVLILGLTLWPPVARLVRAQVLSVRERPYVLAARALGYGHPRILLRHVLPNAMGPAVVAGTLLVGEAIVLEAGLSFLGLGFSPETPSWGAMIYEGLADPLDSWWLSLFPGAAIVTTVLLVNLVGEGARESAGIREWLEVRE